MNYETFKTSIMEKLEKTVTATKETATDVKDHVSNKWDGFSTTEKVLVGTAAATVVTGATALCVVNVFQLSVMATAVAKASGAAAGVTKLFTSIGAYLVGAVASLFASTGIGAALGSALGYSVVAHSSGYAIVTSSTGGYVGGTLAALDALGVAFSASVVGLVVATVATAVYYAIITPAVYVVTTAAITAACFVAAGLGTLTYKFV